MADITNQQLLDSMTEQVGVITSQMVTKDDLQEALKDYPTTKQDLRNELKALQSQHDRDYGDIRGRLTRAADAIA